MSIDCLFLKKFNLHSKYKGKPERSPTGEDALLRKDRDELLVVMDDSYGNKEHMMLV